MKKSIIVSNMEIAEFMGLESKIERMAAINPDTGRVMKCLEEVLCYRIKFAKWVRYDALKYHKSWDWLMPVVRKIYDSDEHAEWHCNTPMFADTIENTLRTAHFEGVYNAVVSFIKWYNENENER